MHQLRYLRSLDPAFEGSAVPITRHMYYTWKKYDLQNRYPLDTEAGRFNFSTWYITAHAARLYPRRLPLHAKTIQYYNEELFDAALFAVSRLDQPARGEQRPLRWPVTRLMLALWRLQGRETDNLFSYHAYKAFLHWYVCTAFNKFALAEEFLTDELAYVARTPKQHLMQVMALDDLFIREFHGNQERYGHYSLDAPTERIAFAGKATLTMLEQNVPIHALQTAHMAWWKEPVDGSSPPLSRMELLLYHRRFTSEHTEEIPAGTERRKFLHWLGTAYLGRYPALTSLCPHAVPEPKWSAGNGIRIIGPVRSTSGLGNVQKSMYEPLERLKIDYLIENFTLDTGFTRGRYLKRSATSSRFAPVAEKMPVNLFHLNLEHIPDAYALLPEQVSSDSYAICYSFWEIEKIVELHYLASACIDELWVASSFVESIYKDKLGIPVTKIGMNLQQYLDQAVTPLPRSMLNIPEDSTVFFFSYDTVSSIVRKNPQAVVDAFRKAFFRGNEKVTLILKTRNVEHGISRDAPWHGLVESTHLDSRILLLTDDVSAEDYHRLLAMSDCYVSLHRSEGFGLGPAEAMAMGKPVIVTDYGGTTDFADEDTALTVPYSRLEVRQDDYYWSSGGAYWADPDISKAAEYMRSIHKSKALRKRIGRAARKRIEEKYSLKAFSENVVARLSQLDIINTHNHEH